MAPSTAPSPAALVDMSAPLVWQMWGLRKAEYLAWVHEPFSFAAEGKNGQRDARLFGWDILEPFTKTVWWVVPLVWLPIAAYFAQPWAASVGYSPLACAAVLAGGLLFWSLAEYSVHRFLFHVDAAVPDMGAALLLHFLLHGIHHKVPMDRYRLVMPPVLFAALAVTGYSLLAPLAALAAVAPPLFNALFGAVLVGYVGYDLMHYSQHHVHFSRTSYFGQMKSYHMKHHFSGQENVGFGITNTLWDHVFGTLLDVNKKPSASAQADEARMLEAIDGGGKSS